MVPILRSRTASVVLIAALSLSCQRAARTDAVMDSLRASAGDTDWELVELFGQPAPPGAGGRLATLRFASDTNRASGFGGCNRFSGMYASRGDSLRFERVAMTKMACDAGMELEQRFARALDATRRYELGAAGLALLGDSGIVARLVRRP
jgi:heat shock protein HslJ